VRSLMQEDGDLGYLQLSGRMSRIRDHIYVVMRSGLVLKGLRNDNIWKMR